MDDLNELCGRLCWAWTEIITVQDTEIKEQ